MESYTLREVAELLGISKRTLQRRIQEGAFPGRFLAPGRHGLETRIPAEDVRRMLDELRRHGQAAWRESPEVGQREDGLVKFGETALPPERVMESGLTYRDLDSLRDAVLAIVREERDVFMRAVKVAMDSKDQEISRLRDDMGRIRSLLDSMRGEMREVRQSLSTESKKEGWSEVMGVGPESVDVEVLLKQMGELEAMVNSLSLDDVSRET